MSIIEGLSWFGERYFNFITRGIAEGLSANRIIKSIAEAGLPTARRSTMLRDIRLIRGVERVVEPMRYVGRERVISDRLYAPSDKPMHRRYYTVVRVEGYDVETGEKFSQHVTVAHDTLLKRSEIEEAAEGLMIDESPTKVVEKVTPVFGRRYTGGVA
ncbi:MAG: hypothetical protein JRE40_15290 [Deltaproteobacteria bacterium]|nr:hypothetical protein [Deltaproteobacteria bacterium]